MTTPPYSVVGIHGTRYIVGVNVQAEKPDGKVFFIPLEDIIQIVAQMKRIKYTRQSDAEILGLP